jgi:hypothetical protein
MTNDGSSLGTGGETDFLDSSTAGSASITNNGNGDSGAGVTQFAATSTAGSASITNNGGTASGTIRGSTEFRDTSTADSATLIANGGLNGGSGGSIFFSKIPPAARRGWRFSAIAIWTSAVITLRA